MSVTVTVL